jgi:hypothetical protein
VPVLRVALQMVLGIVVTLGLQLLLRAWATPERRARGWNFATWGSALQWFGPLSMLGFCVVHGKLTFGGVVLSLLRAVVWTLLIAVTLSLVDVGFIGRYGTLREKREVMESFGPIEAPAPANPTRPKKPGKRSGTPRR